jgi:DNA-binding NarL/FixJ family response regulator
MPALRKRIAFVTDDANAVDRHVRALEDHSDVEIVASGAAAIELVLVDRSVELVIYTARNADLTPCQFLDNLRWMVPGHPPVVVVGESDPAEKDKAMALGAAGSVSARCGARVLSNRIERLLYAEPEPSDAVV